MVKILSLNAAYIMQIAVSLTATLCSPTPWQPSALPLACWSAKGSISPDSDRSRSKGHGTRHHPDDFPAAAGPGRGYGQKSRGCRREEILLCTTWEEPMWLLSKVRMWEVRQRAQESRAVPRKGTQLLRGWVPCTACRDVGS